MFLRYDNFDSISFLLGLGYVIFALQISPFMFGSFCRIFHLEPEKGLFGFGTMGYTITDKLIYFIHGKKDKS